MLDLNALSLDDLARELFESERGSRLVRRLLELARDEDLGRGDATATVALAPGESASAAVVAREPATVAGLALLPALLSVFASGVTIELAVRDGDRVARGDTLATIAGPARSVVGLERTLLNLLGRLCGVATLTARYVEAIPPGSRARVCDTRKTTPGLRLPEKYAVRCGGGHLHRLGLDDAVLIKDNHLAGLSPEQIASLARSASERARLLVGDRLRFVMVEVDTLDQLRALLGLEAGTVDIVLLDNMSPALIKEAVAMRDASGCGLELEASGGVRLDTIAAIASAGVDRISVGALTHQAASIDLGLDRS